MVYVAFVLKSVWVTAMKKTLARTVRLKYNYIYGLQYIYAIQQVQMSVNCDDSYKLLLIKNQSVFSVLQFLMGFYIMFYNID